MERYNQRLFMEFKHLKEKGGIEMLSVFLLRCLFHP